MSDKLSVAFSEDLESYEDDKGQDDFEYRNSSIPDQRVKDILDLVKNGIITKSEGQKLIEEYKTQSESNRALQTQLLLRKGKTLRRQDTNEKNLAKLVEEGYLTEEEAGVILSDTRAKEKHENFESSSTVGNKDKKRRLVLHNSMRGFSRYEKPSETLKRNTSQQTFGDYNTGKKSKLKAGMKIVSKNAVGVRMDNVNDLSRDQLKFIKTANDTTRIYQMQKKKAKTEIRTCKEFLDIPIIQRNTRTNKIRCIVFACFFFVSVYLLIILPTSYSYINFDEVGIRVGRYSGAIIDVEKVYLPGRYAHGMFQDFVRYKKVILDADLTITGNAYSGNNLLPYAIGTHASNEFGPVTARARNGEKYDIEITMYYQILLNKLIDTHRYYGGYKQLNASIYDAVRYSTRNALSYKTLADVLINRQEVGLHLETNLRRVVQDHGVKFIGLKIGRIIMSSSINSRLFSKELNKKKSEKIKEEGLLLNITLHTKHLENVAVGRRESYAAIKNALIDADVAKQQRIIDLIEAETERIVASTKKIIETNASLVCLDRSNEALNESLKYKTLDLQAELDVKRIETEVLKLRATNDKKKAKILAPAVLFHHTNISGAIHDVETLKAETHAGIFNELRSSLGINRLNLLRLEWIKYIMGDAVDSKKVKQFNSDVPLPTKFGLRNL